MDTPAKLPLRPADFQPPPAATRGPAVVCLSSQQLFGKAREILIEHCGCYYRLRVTHSNKLILTK